MKACDLGTTTIGIKLQDCVILVSEKKIVSRLQKPETIKKCHKIYDTIIAASSGVSGDAPEIIDRCREICLQHEKLFFEQIGTAKLMEDICDLALKFTEKEAEKKIFSRPFGVYLLVAAFEDNRPILYCIDPSGSYNEYKGKAIGSASEVVKTILEEQYESFTDKNEVIPRALKIVKGVMKEALTEYNVDVSIVSAAGAEIFTPEKIKEYIQ